MIETSSGVRQYSYLRQVQPTWDKGEGPTLTEGGPGFSPFATAAIGIILALILVLCFIISFLRIRLWLAHRRGPDKNEYDNGDNDGTKEKQVDKQQLNGNRGAPEPPDDEYISKTMKYASLYVRKCLGGSFLEEDFKSSPVLLSRKRIPEAGLIHNPWRDENEEDEHDAAFTTSDDDKSEEERDTQEGDDTDTEVESVDRASTE